MASNLVPMRKRLMILLILTLICIGAAPSQAASKTTKTVRLNQFARGEYCLYIKDVFEDINNEQPIAHCIQDNDRAYLGLGFGAPPACPNEKAFACLAKYGQLFAGGWPYFHGQGLPYKMLPDTHVVSGYRTSSYVTPRSTMDQPFFARSTLAGSFAYTWTEDVKLCLEVYDWGQSQGKSVYILQTLVDVDCIRPGEALRPLEVTGTVSAGHYMWIVVSLYSWRSDGISYFTIAEVAHDIS